MLNSRLTSLMRKEFIQNVRDPRTLYIVIAIPVIQIFLLGYTATTDVRNVPLAVFDQDRSAASRRLLDAYRAADYFRLAFDVDSEGGTRGLTQGGRARAGAWEGVLHGPGPQRDDPAASALDAHGDGDRARARTRHNRAADRHADPSL